MLFLLVIFTLLTGVNSDEELQLRNQGLVPKKVKIGIIIEYFDNDSQYFPLSYRLKDAINGLLVSHEIIKENPELLPYTDVELIKKEIFKGDSFEVLDTACKLSNEGIIGMIGLTSCSSSASLRAFTEAIKVPLILVATEDCNIQHGAMYNLQQSLVKDKLHDKDAELLSYGNYFFGVGGNYHDTIVQSLEIVDKIFF